MSGINPTGHYRSFTTGSNKNRVMRYLKEEEGADASKMLFMCLVERDRALLLTQASFPGVGLVGLIHHSRPGPPFSFKILLCVSSMTCGATIEAKLLRKWIKKCSKEPEVLLRELSLSLMFHASRIKPNSVENVSIIW